MKHLIAEAAREADLMQPVAARKLSRAAAEVRATCAQAEHTCSAVLSCCDATSHSCARELCVPQLCIALQMLCVLYISQVDVHFAMLCQEHVVGFPAGWHDHCRGGVWPP